MIGAKGVLFAVGLIGSALFASSAATAGPLPTYPTGVGAGVWNVDRYAPAGFANVGSLFGRNDVLGLDISAADSQANRPSAYSHIFYNTQGRQFRLDIAGDATLRGSLYVPLAWATTNVGDAALNRRSDLWTRVTTPDDSEANADYPIIGFTNSAPADALNAGGVGRFRVWDADAGGWQDLATAVAYDAWADFSIALLGDSYVYSINGAVVYTDSTVGVGAVFTTAFVQAYNFGASYTANWSEIAVETVPEPGTLALFSAGLIGVAVQRRRKRS